MFFHTTQPVLLASPSSRVRVSTLTAISISEHLVRLTLGLEHVIHNIPLQHGELECLQEQVQVSLREVGNPDWQPPKSLAGYRLGYHVVQRLLDEDHSWLSLLRSVADNFRF